MIDKNGVPISEKDKLDRIIKFVDENAKFDKHKYDSNVWGNWISYSFTCDTDVKIDIEVTDFGNNAFTLYIDEIHFRINEVKSDTQLLQLSQSLLSRARKAIQIQEDEEQKNKATQVQTIIQGLYKKIEGLDN